MATTIAALSTPRDTRIDRQRVGWAAVALLTATYVGFFAQLTSYPYQDFANHLARAVVLADLIFDHGTRFGHLFEFRFMPVPYLLGDLSLAALVALLGPTVAAALWMTLVLVSLPAALFFYTHVNGPRGDRRIFVLLVSLYLATDWFFLLGFTQFRLGLALVIVAMGCADLARERASRPAFAAYCATLVIGYFTHLASIVFVAPALGVSGAVRLLYRRTTLWREVAILAPVGLILLWHFGFADRAYHGDAMAPYAYDWGTLGNRIEELQFELLRFAQAPAKLLMMLLTGAVCWGLWRDLRWHTLLQPRVVEMFALAMTFLAIYFVLPNAYSDASYVAPRALAFVALFVVLGRAYLGAEAVEHPDPAAKPSLTQAAWVPIAALLAMLNLLYLSAHLTLHDAFAAAYRQIVAQIPRGATVLPVYTGGRDGLINTRLHLGSLAVMDRDALIPYLFAGDAGHPMKYFRYRHRPYAPPEHWYASTVPVMVAWRPIACTYQYLLIGKPYDVRKLAVATSVRAENESAALLAIHPGPDECQHRVR